MNNTTGSVWQPVAVTATGLTTVTGNVFVARTPEVFSYDLDGNMISDGRWNYTWDAENRLIKVESRPDTPSSSWRRIEWTYDALGRRIQQVTSIWTNNSWFVVENLKFVSDPMLFGRHIVELNGTNNTLVRSYAWGLDLSGTMDGAGGVGGLAWVTLHAATGSAPGTHFTCYDSNGNIVALISSTTGEVTARYEYGPFGEPIRISGPAASLNHFRFSTKRMDSTTDLVLFEYWAYRPTTGRWPNRDPLGEFADLNLYRFNYNSPINYFDPDGLWGIAFGNSSGSSYFNIGWGDPTFYFSPESWDDIGQASQAMLDGIIPFVDPFGDNGGYDKNDPMLSLSRELGEAARDIYLGKCALIGQEFSFGKNIRVAPFGNRTKPGQSFNWRRELPHYHRRGAPGSGAKPHQDRELDDIDPGMVRHTTLLG